MSLFPCLEGEGTSASEKYFLLIIFIYLSIDSFLSFSLNPPETP